jgi:histidinol-phosphate aminotransferase
MSTSPYWSALTASLTPYVPGEQPRIEGLVKLNTNENPFPPSPKVHEAIAAAVGTLARYPDPNATDFCQAVADHVGVPLDHVFAGNGSDEVLAVVFQALLKHDKPTLMPDITYSFYPVYCRLYDIQYRALPLNDRFSIDLDDYVGDNGGVIFANPNAPTGCPLALSDIAAFLDRNTQSVVVVDEAYVDFGGESAVTLVGQYPNLLVIQTLSKSRSLAGLRVGFAVGQPTLIDALQRVKNSFNSYPVDHLAIAGGTAAMRDVAYFERTRQAIMATRTRLTEELQARGFEVLPSATNFVFARHPGHDGKALAAGLRAEKVLVRRFDAPRIDQFLRISIGSEADTDALLLALDKVLAA